MLRRPRYHEPRREDHQTNQERSGRSDPIAEPAGHDGREEHADHEEGEQPGVVGHAVEFAGSGGHGSGHCDRLEGDGHDGHA
jgi:hypothetical protein